MTDLRTHPRTRGHEHAATRRRRLNPSTWHFIRHYAEMVAATLRVADRATMLIGA